MEGYHPIGLFDSGYGGLTVMKDIVKALPEYDYLYLGDNARSPYGNRSFETVYQYTLEAVKWFFAKGCPLVILACNTASAKALRSIQQRDLPAIGENKRVLGVIRPTAEVIGRYSKTGEIGVLATNGTVSSGSYALEIGKFFPGLKVHQQACPMWVPLVENDEHEGDGADYFIQKELEKISAVSTDIDVLLLACTHYPLLQKKIEAYAQQGVKIVSQGELVANSLRDYLHRHEEITGQCSRNAVREFFTTDSTADFDRQATKFFGQEVRSRHTDLG